MKAEWLTQNNLTKAEWLEQNGFNSEGITYCICGDTYSIKDTLKAKGCKFNRLLKWHSTDPLDGYTSFAVSFDEIYQWDFLYNAPLEKESAEGLIKDRTSKVTPPIESNSEYMGEIGERLRGLPAKVTDIHKFNGKYGETTVITFAVDENVLIWFTATSQKVNAGDVIQLTGTVVDHMEYKGIKTTKLNRCRLVEVV